MYSGFIKDCWLLLLKTMRSIIQSHGKCAVKLVALRDSALLQSL